jgi:hypothetical protein
LRSGRQYLARHASAVDVALSNAQGSLFLDEFVVSFHLHFHKILKWLLVLPLAACAAAVMALRPTDARESLPS